MLDEDALICDLAETYGVLDYEALPPSTTAALFAGLRDDARSMLRLSGAQAGTDRLLLAAVADRLSLLLWAQTVDGVHNRNRPQSIVSVLSGDQTAHGNVRGFKDGAAFEAARAKIVGGERCGKSTGRA